MASHNPGTKEESSDSIERKKSKVTWVIALLAGLCVMFIVLWVLSSKGPDTLPSPSETGNGSIELNDVSEAKGRELVQLVGRWIRTDGGYVIDIQKIDADGELEAGYYNPRPINVSRAEATWARSGSEVFIELQDQGYPGSTYTLTYDPSKDILRGFYFQAAMQQEFDVIFVRMD